MWSSFACALAFVLFIFFKRWKADGGMVTILAEQGGLRMRSKLICPQKALNNSGWDGGMSQGEGQGWKHPLPQQPSSYPSPRQEKGSLIPGKSEQGRPQALVQLSESQQERVRSHNGETWWDCILCNGTPQSCSLTLLLKCRECMLLLGRRWRLLLIKKLNCLRGRK